MRTARAAIGLLRTEASGGPGPAHTLPSSTLGLGGNGLCCGSRNSWGTWLGQPEQTAGCRCLKVNSEGTAAIAVGVHEDS